ncbi:MAG TPA: ATP-binding protein [Actinomycetes bacterium]|nr:ATP-binding protein [Actinomycetes bacterium]
MPTSLTSLLADPGRLAALRRTNLLDTAAEEAFDRLARLAARLLRAPIALVTLVDQDRQFLKACLGVPEPWASARQLPLSHSLCQRLLVTGQPLVIGDARGDPLARGNQAVVEFGVAAYLGIPLRFAGQVLGSLCVADRRPRSWTDDDVALLADVAGLVMTEVELRAGLDARRPAAPAGHEQAVADLAPRPELERRLADLEASYQALLDRLPGVVYTLGPEAPNPVLYISPQLQALLGERAADWIGNSDIWAQLVHPEDADRVAAECERTNQTGEPFVAEYRMCTRAGEVRWVRDEAVLVRGGDGRPLFWQGILTDVSATHLTAARLAEALDREQEAAHRLAAALERERAAAEHLRAVDEMKTTFLQAVSHDLRTPLTTVLGISLTLERRAAGLPADDVADLLRRLSTSARKLDGLLADLLDLDRLARGTLSPRRQVVDVGGLTRRVVDDAGVAAEHTVVVDAPPVAIAVDAPKVERIVENLVVNAARHTAAGTTIWVCVQPQPDGGVLLLVEDEGPGVPAELREQIFQPFRKGRNVADYAPGSGIGLALVARFATLHGGRAWVEDRPGGGASFRVLLPQGQLPDAAG